MVPQCSMLLSWSSVDGEAFIVFQESFTAKALQGVYDHASFDGS